MNGDRWTCPTSSSTPRERCPRQSSWRSRGRPFTPTRAGPPRSSPRPRIERRVREARDALAQQGRKFLGVQALLQQPFDAVPKTTEPRRTPNPRIAAKHTPERVQAIRNLVTFLRGYRAAWHAWRHGKREQVFPLAPTRSASTPASPTRQLVRRSLAPIMLFRSTRARCADAWLTPNWQPAGGACPPPRPPQAAGKADRYRYPPPGPSHCAAKSSTRPC
jgi:hypothetical protein